MLCFRCGSQVPEGNVVCTNCGQELAGGVRQTLSMGSIKAIERRRKRQTSMVISRAERKVGDIVAGRFEIKDIIGLGPMGVVYRAHDKEIEVDVALKAIRADILKGAGGQERLGEMVLQTFQSVILKNKSLSQQNIVRTYDVVLDEGRAYISMQYLEGLTLRKVISLRKEKKQVFKLKEVEPLISQISLALNHAHQTCVHGDLKPENVVILPDILKVTDFRLYEAIPQEAFLKAQEAAGDMFLYLAPEMRRGERVDRRSDVFSLGVILTEMLTGQLPRHGFFSLAMVNKELPRAIDDVIRRALDNSPANRYDSADELSEDLISVMETGHTIDDGQAMVPPPGMGLDDTTARRPIPAEGQRESTLNVPIDVDMDPTHVTALPPMDPDEAVEDVPTRPVPIPAIRSAEGSPVTQPTVPVVIKKGPPPETLKEASRTPTVPLPTPPKAKGTSLTSLILISGIVVVIGVGTFIVVSHIMDMKRRTAQVQTQAQQVLPVVPEGEVVTVASAGRSAALDAGLAPAAAPQRADVKPSPPDRPVVVAAKAPPDVGAKARKADIAPPPPRVEEPKRPERVAVAPVVEPPKKVGCPKGMIHVKSRKGDGYCIDRYEYPGAGAMPLRVSYERAELSCKGKGKRICKESEWQGACYGRRGGKFPYGKEFDASACNTEDANGAARAVKPSGSFRKCKSAYGAFDMSGNVSEWVQGRVTKGGAANTPDYRSNCTVRARSGGGPFVGFRCCADPE